MKVNELFEGRTKAMSAVEATAHYEKFKRWHEEGLNGVKAETVATLKKAADAAWDAEFKKGEKNLIDVHGAEWWELARKQYPITKKDGEYIVKSNFALDPDSGKRGPWPFDSEGQAKDKIVQLVKWLSGGRKKGYGNKDDDIQKWFKSLDSVDKAKIAT